jgi:hypothetical protein
LRYVQAYFPGDQLINGVATDFIVLFALCSLDVMKNQG